MKLSIPTAVLLALVASDAVGQRRLDPRHALDPRTTEDPIGSNFEIGTMTDGAQTAAAYDPISDTYLVAFSPDRDSCGPVWTRMVASDGTILGPATPVSPATILCGHDLSVTVTGSSRARFLVSLTGNDGSATATHVFALDESGVVVDSLQFGGSRNRGSSIGCGIQSTIALVVYPMNARIEVARIDVDTMNVTGILQTGITAGPSAISTTSNGTGRHLIVWQQVNALGIGGMILDDDLTPLSPELAISTIPTAVAPAVAGDGDRWAVAYVRPATVTGQVFCASVVYDSQAGTATVENGVLVAGSGNDERNPRVAMMGDSYLVAYTRRFSIGDDDVWARAVNFDCTPCGTPFQLATSNDTDTGIAIASQLEGTGTEALVTWANQPTTGLSIIRGRRIAESVGSIQNLGGGCGNGGDAATQCAKVGGRLEFELVDATPVTNVVLLLGASLASSPCGPCTLIPNPVAAVPTLVDLLGTASWTTSLLDPALEGGVLYSQWVTLASGGCGALSFSDGHAITIE